MKRCTRCGQEKPMDAFRHKPRKNDGRVATCRPCEAQLGRGKSEEERRCACGTVLRSTNPKAVCGRCDAARGDAGYGNLSGLIALEKDLRSRLERYDREITRLLDAYRSIADKPSPEAYLVGLTNHLDDLCVLAEVEVPEIEDVFPREWFELVSGERIGVVTSEGAGRLVCGEVHEAPAPSEEMSA